MCCGCTQDRWEDQDRDIPSPSKDQGQGEGDVRQETILRSQRQARTSRKGQPGAGAGAGASLARGEEGGAPTEPLPIQSSLKISRGAQSWVVNFPALKTLPV